jgi:hypothetical protein
MHRDFWLSCINFILLNSTHQIDHNSVITGSCYQVDVLCNDTCYSFQKIKKMNFFSKYDKQNPDFCAWMKDGPKIMLKYRPNRRRRILRTLKGLLTLSWPAGHICPTYKEYFQVHCDDSIPLFLHAAIYLEVYLFRWTSQKEFSSETTVYKWYCVQCCMQYCTQDYLYTAVSRENAFWLIQRNRDTSR